MPAQPTNAGAGDRLRLELVGVDHALPVVELAPPAGVRRRHLTALGGRQALDRRARDVGENLVHAPRQSIAMRCKAGLEQRLELGFAAVDAFHDEERALEPCRVGLEKQRPRHRHRRVGEGAVEVELDAAVGVDQAGLRVAPDDEALFALLAAALEPAQVDRPGLARGAAGNAKERVTARSCASCRRAVK